MKSIFENVIARGNYELTGLLNKIDSYHIEGKLTDAERDELYARARVGAKVENGADMIAKLAELEARIKALEDSKADSGSASAAEETIAEYTPGKWYYTGDKVTFGGNAYVCAAPDGQVCVWSPSEYPAYWTAYIPE